MARPSSKMLNVVHAFRKNSEGKPLRRKMTVEAYKALKEVYETNKQGFPVASHKNGGWRRMPSDPTIGEDTSAIIAEAVSGPPPVDPNGAVDSKIAEAVSPEKKPAAKKPAAKK